MNIFIKPLMVAVLSGLSAVTCAGTSGMYLDAGLGVAMQQCDLCSSDIDPGFAGKIAAGYRFNSFLAAEVGYAGGGGTWANTSRGDLGMNTSTAFGAVVAMVPIGSVFEVFGRVGYGRSSTELVTKDINYKSRSDNDLVYGFGIGYRQPETIVTVRLEYNRFCSDQSLETDSADIVGPNGLAMVNLGIVLNF